jgi:hypothetical protein
MDKKAANKAERDGVRISWIIAKSGECFLIAAGAGGFTDAAGAAWTLRQFADAIEHDAEGKTGSP